MRELLEKILQLEEQFYTGDSGYIDLDGKKITGVTHHAIYAKDYFEKHNISIPSSGEEIIAKFLDLTGYIRYYVESREVDFTIATPINSIQLNTMKRMSKNRIVIFDIIDSKGCYISSGEGFSNLISSLEKKNLLVEITINELDIKKALRTTAVAGVIGAVPLGLGYRKGLSQKAIEKPTPAVAVEKPTEKVSIDMKKIAEIESSSNPEVENSRTGARGLHQIMKETWEEVVSKIGTDWSWDDAFDAEKNTKVANYYMNIEIPRLLKHFGIEDTIENRLASYNWGVGNLDRAGSEWMEKAPQETLDYIEKYKSL